MDATTQEAFALEHVPENYLEPLNVESVFERTAPLEVDLGCGDGSFLAAVAKQNPERNFLGLERLTERVRSACRKIAKQNLANARVLRIESSYAVTYLLPANSITAFYLLFPDPWPKRRHQHRRIVTEEFLDALHRALAPDGLFVATTDNREYFNQIQRLTSQSRNFTESLVSPALFPATTFEKHFRKRGLEIHRLMLRKVSPVK